MRKTLAAIFWLYIGGAIVTLLFQSALRWAQCLDFTSCGLSFGKALAWSALWPAYWLLYGLHIARMCW